MAKKNARVASNSPLGLLQGPRGPFRSLVVLGESTVQGGGWLRNDDERWANVLHRLVEDAQERKLRYHNAGLGASVISSASPGYEASNKPSAAERLDREVIAKRPDLLVIAYGLNDMRAGMSPRAFRAEMEKLIARVRARCQCLIVLANVYHMTVYNYYPPFDRGSLKVLKAYNAMLRKLAQEQGCAYADIWSAQGQDDSVVHLDTVHANKIGNTLIANKVFETIVHAAPGLGDSMNRRDKRTPWSRMIVKWQRKCVEKSGR